MILVDKDIRDRVINYVDKPLIEGFKEENLQAASYDVTMTNKIKRFTYKMQRVSFRDKNSIDSSSETVDISFGYDMKPGEFILVKLNEYLNMTSDLVAHLRPRTTFNRLGLILSPQHINPTYSGRLSLGLFNASPYIVEIFPDLIIGQLVFEQLSGTPDEAKLYKNKPNAKYQNEDDFVNSKVTDEIDAKYLKLFKSMISSGRIDNE